MKRFLILCGLLLAPLAAEAQIIGRTAATLAVDYDLASGVLIYPVYLGPKSEPLSDGFVSECRVKTTGSNTAITVVTAASGCFTNVAQFDLLVFQLRSGLRAERLVSVRTDANNVTADSAINLDVTGPTGYSFRYKTFTAATGAAAGWIPVHGFDAGVQFNVQVKVFAATSITAQVECRQEGDGSGPTVVASKVFTATGTLDAFVELPFFECRLGLSISGDAGTNGVSAQFTGLHTR